MTLRIEKPTSRPGVPEGVEHILCKRLDGFADLLLVDEHQVDVGAEIQLASAVTPESYERHSFFDRVFSGKSG